jgi:signal peptidase I
MMRNDLKALFSVANLKAAWDFVREPVIVAGVLMISTTAIAQPFYIPSGSMEPTLQIGDGLIATKYDYGYSRYSVPFAMGPSSETRLLQKAPKRGDIVIFRDPSNTSKTLIKRLIGLPGDHVQMIAGRLWINGAKLPLKEDGIGTAEGERGETYQVARYIETLPNGLTYQIFKQGSDGELDNTEEFVVPKDHFFMMGDNRDDSLDSRLAANEGGVGFVPIENLVGHAQVVVGSYDYIGALSDKGVFERLRASRFFKTLD